MARAAPSSSRRGAGRVEHTPTVASWADTLDLMPAAHASESTEHAHGTADLWASPQRPRHPQPGCRAAQDLCARGVGIAGYCGVRTALTAQVRVGVGLAARHLLAKDLDRHHEVRGESVSPSTATSHTCSAGGKNSARSRAVSSASMLDLHATTTEG